MSDEKSFGNENPMFDWTEFRNKFFGDDAWKQMFGNGQLPWIEQYVRNIVSNVLPPAFSVPSQQTVHSSVTVNVFETHEGLIVRVRIPEDADPRAVRLFVGTNELAVRGPWGEKRVKLPSVVRPEEAKAVYKSRVFELKLAPEHNDRFKEIPVRYMD